MSNPQRKSLNTPDQVLNMDRGRIDIVEIAGGGVGRATFMRSLGRPSSRSQSRRVLSESTRTRAAPRRLQGRTVR